MKESLSAQLASRSEALVWTETVLLAVINIVALFGNLLTCYAVYRNPRLRTIPNMFVVALGVSDILMSTCCMPFSVATLFHGRWMFGERFCCFQGYESLAIGLISLHTMGIIAISRYFCVVKPAKYALFFNKRKPLIHIVIVWCVALVGSVPPFFFKNGGFEFQPGMTICLYSFESNIAYTVFIQSVYITAPLIIITICYAKVFHTVSKTNRVFSHQNNLQQLRTNVEEAKVTKTLVAVMFGFSCCWLPVCVVNIMDAARGEKTLPREVYLTYGMLVHLSSCINPFIYAVTNRQFRREYKVILRKIVSFRCQNNNNGNGGSLT